MCEVIRELMRLINRKRDDVGVLCAVLNSLSEMQPSYYIFTTIEQFSLSS